MIVNTHAIVFMAGCSSIGADHSNGGALPFDTLATFTNYLLGKPQYFSCLCKKTSFVNTFNEIVSI